MNASEETRRILDMMDNGTISAVEGARLLESTRTAYHAGTMPCPYCAESIPAGSSVCPECNSDLDGRPVHSGESSGFLGLTGLGKFLALYSLLVGGIGLASPFYHGVNLWPWLFTGPNILGLLLSGLGLLTGVLMLKGNSAAWRLGMLWSALQIVTVVVNDEIINQQIFHLGVTFETIGRGLGLNLIGIILLILFIKDKNKRRTWLWHRLL